LPAGNLAFAAGFEHREEDGFFQPDAVVVAGDSMGVPSSPTSGGFDVDEFYVELRADLLSDQPFADQLDVQLAARNSDYDTFGDDTTLAYGLNWRPVETFLVRYNFAEGFRAPGIGELFGNVSRFDADLSDPCSNLNAVADQNVVNNCIAQGVDAGGSYTQINPQISVSTGGNPLLQPEESDTTTISLVWSPNAVDNYDWVDGFSAEVLFYDIELDDAIQAIDAQTQLDQCAATNDPALCDGISRVNNGAINGFSNQLTNIGGIDTNGYDINLAYTSPETSWGTFKLSWFNTFVDEFEEKGITGSRKLEGVEENDSSIPEWKSTFITDWYMGDFGASWTIRHIDEVTESCSDSSDNTANSFTALGLCSNPNTADETMSTNDLDATTYHDVQFIWRPVDLVEGLELTVGIQNLFDEDPPKCVSCSLNGYDAATHDAPGQFGYVRFGLKFE
jgi:iron complex outermembrane receptor protein